MSPPLTPQQVELRDRHRDYFLALVQSAYDAIDAGEDARPWHVAVDVEVDNVRAALAWCASRHDTSLAPLASAMRWWWESNHLFREAHEWLGQALGLDGLSAAQRSGVLRALTGLHGAQGDREAALAAGLEAVGEAREADDPALEAVALSEVGWVHYARGEMSDAAAAFERVVEVGLAAVPLGRYLHALRGLGWAVAGLDDLDRALACHEEARQLARSSGDRYLLADHLLIHANLLLVSGRASEGLELLDEQAEMLRSLGDAFSLAYNRCRFAEGQMGLGQLERAREACEEAIALAGAATTASSVGQVSETTVRAQPLLGFAALAIEAGDLARAELALADALAVIRSEREPAAVEKNLYDYALELLARVALERGELERAAALTRERLDAASGQDRRVVDVLCDLARVSLDQRDMAGAERHFADALGLLDDADWAGSDVTHESLLAEMRFELGDLAGACDAIDSAIARAGDQVGFRSCMLRCRASTYRLALGDTEAASTAIAEADALLGDAPNATRYAAWPSASVAAALGDASRTRSLLRDAAAFGMAPRTRVSVLETLAELAATEGRAERAVALLATATSERARLSFPRRADASALERRVRTRTGDLSIQEPPPLDPVAALAEELTEP